MGRKKAFRWRGRVAAALLLAAVVGGAWAWWQAQHWMPSRQDYPMQGVLLGAADGPVDFRALAAIGANFVYLEASQGAAGRDAAFAANLAALTGGPLPFGVVHEFDPCIPAERQAANFVTIVPRSAALLPPVIALDKPASACGDPAIENGVEAELTTFLNQVEGHSGQAAILRLSPDFEAQYHVASRIERNLWLERGWLEPEYAGRPFTLWTANPQLATEVTEHPVRWVVAQR
ncbi:MAG: glycoside hydrolase family 25 protein [Pseudomonadota bacterium]